MTTYEHFMISISFGCVLGWMISNIGMIVYYGVKALREKIKARREKKAIEATETKE